jgi:hypothetical protein
MFSNIDNLISNDKSVTGFVEAINKVRPTWEVFTDILQTLTGTLSTVNLIGKKIQGDDKNEPIKTNAQQVLIPNVVYDDEKATINNHTYTLSKLRSVLFSIIKITVISLLTLGGIMTLANKKVTEKYVKEYIKPLINRLKIDEILKFLILITQRIMNYLKTAYGSTVNKIRSRLRKMNLFNDVTKSAYHHKSRKKIEII